MRDCKLRARAQRALEVNLSIGSTGDKYDSSVLHRVPSLKAAGPRVSAHPSALLNDSILTVSIEKISPSKKEERRRPQAARPVRFFRGVGKAKEASCDESDCRAHRRSMILR